MNKISLKIQKGFCEECSMALRRFIGRMDGVESVGVESGNVVISFDSAKIGEEDLLKLTVESIEKLGYKTVD